MAVKYYCDGCDENLGDRKNKVTVNIADKQPAPLLGREFDLCAACTQRLARSADPTTWHRAAHHQ